MYSLRNYFEKLKKGKIVLWCYLIWYCVTVSFYMDFSIQLWVNSLGISAVIGFALMLSVSQGKAAKREFWQIFRLFMMPFCVSSYSALIKDKGFILIFSPKGSELMIALGACLLFCFLVFLVKWRAKRVCKYSLP